MSRLRSSRTARRGPHRHPSMALAVVPTMFTLGNLLCGFAAIHFAARGPGWEGPWHWTGLTIAGLLVFVGMFFDGVDGSIARLTRTNSAIGAELDSLSDMVTFGVAPAFMAVRLVINHFEQASLDQVAWVIGPEADTVIGRIIWAIAAAFALCAALRLARFNAESGLKSIYDHNTFRGLPSPGAAGAVVSLVILHQHLLVTRFRDEVPLSFVQWSTLVIPFVMLLCALGMVSTIPYPHFTNRYFRGPKSFAFIARTALVLTLTVMFLHEMLAIAFTAYALSGPIAHLIRRRAVNAGLPPPHAGEG